MNLSPYVDEIFARKKRRNRDNINMLGLYNFNLSA